VARLPSRAHQSERMDSMVDLDLVQHHFAKA
jgi:hypothetical protein